MKSHLYHLQININYDHFHFYNSLMKFMGWNIIFEADGMCGYTSGTGGDLWFIKSDTNKETDYDNIGVNHISLRVETQKDVDDIKDFLENKNVEMLFGTPKHRPEFAMSEKETYYQIMFESPDNILFEVVYVGKK